MLLDAALRGDVDLFEYLLSKGADTACRDNQGKSLVEYIKAEYGMKTNAPKTQMIKDRLN